MWRPSIWVRHSSRWASRVRGSQRSPTAVNQTLLHLFTSWRPLILSGSHMRTQKFHRLYLILFWCSFAVYLCMSFRFDSLLNWSFFHSQRCCNPIYLITIGFDDPQAITKDTKIKVIVYDVKERMTNTVSNLELLRLFVRVLWSTHSNFFCGMEFPIHGWFLSSDMHPKHLSVLRPANENYLCEGSFPNVKDSKGTRELWISQNISSNSSQGIISDMYMYTIQRQLPSFCNTSY